MLSSQVYKRKSARDHEERVDAIDRRSLVLDLFNVILRLLSLGVAH
jgi:hypothetical protein